MHVVGAKLLLAGQLVEFHDLKERELIFTLDSWPPRSSRRHVGRFWHWRRFDVVLEVFHLQSVFQVELVLEVVFELDEQVVQVELVVVDGLLAQFAKGLEVEKIEQDFN